MWVRALACRAWCLPSAARSWMCTASTAWARRPLSLGRWRCSSGCATCMACTRGSKRSPHRSRSSAAVRLQRCPTLCAGRGLRCGRPMASGWRSRASTRGPKSPPCLPMCRCFTWNDLRFRGLPPRAASSGCGPRRSRTLCASFKGCRRPRPLPLLHCPIAPLLHCPIAPLPLRPAGRKEPMFGIADYGAFVAAIVLFLAIPGPGNLALITSTTKGGVRAGLAATLGVIAGDQLLMWLAVAGVATLLSAYPAAFAAVQWLGAAYLAWLGCKMLTAAPGAPPVLHIRPHHYFRQAALITLLNPKAIVFYMAFFPLFVDPARHQGLLTFALMAATIAALTFAYGLVVVLLTQHLAARMRANPMAARVLEKLAGVFLIGFGIKLAIAK